ncbi:heavy metal translocating P-type ATPase [Lysobacter solisilvae (ex Woo and Kim 2020)]|uniref:Cadmium-translocating P-type ATPase n=1 Tax=Agrilutibacter terrestris TaxID=2865112 RepID=A0A7H0FWJ7_9GAMM|nr:heavy metal translocating P-type ATPase [Lysobacter terrestris]QNP40413.1 cadmium-translocating P-type ATPase [Lysobacter terrestris]
MAATPASVSALPGAAIVTVAPACFHCGEPVPASPVRIRLDGAEREFCCDGCAAAAQWIRDARLDDYYRLRSEPAARVDTDDAALALWDREEILATHARAVPGGRELTLLTDGMRCAACAWLIDRALAREAGVLEVSANAMTGRIRIAWDPARTALSAPLRRLAALGYRPYLATGEAGERARRAERNRWLLRLGVAGLGAMQAMMFAEALYLDTAGTMSLAMRDFLRWVTFLVSTPVVFYAGWPFLAGCVRELRHRRLGMDTLIATSTLLAYFASLVETVRGGPQVWYDAAVMFVFLLLAARMLEQRVRSVATAQVDALARAKPAFATRERDDGVREQVPLAMLAVGDIACIAVGEAVPADGTLLDARGDFEEALLTGESRAVGKTQGMPVFAGTLCRTRPARIHVTATGASTRLSQLARLVERAQAHRPAQAQAADRIAAWFVLALLVVAGATFLFWRAHEPARAFEVTLALLVISCPCALSLAVPAALAAANGALARMGVLPVRADALERLARTTDVVFDKTGTLGDGQPRLLDVTAFDGMDRAHALRIATALERDSGHPLAHAFTTAEPQPAAPLAANDVIASAGQGLEGSVEGTRWRLGHARFACDRDDDGAVWLGDGRRASARFEIRESERHGAREALQALRDAGMHVHLSSGDAADAVARFAQALGIVDAHARQTPEAKLALVRRLQHEGRHVAMVGDGSNDAPVLAGADVSIAMGEGAALAQGAADLVMTSPSLTRIPAAIALARRTRRIVRQNLGWALAYNLLALPLAMAGLVTPWLAALGMTLSSLAVTLNALRLARATAPALRNAAAATREVRA